MEFVNRDRLLSFIIAITEHNICTRMFAVHFLRRELVSQPIFLHIYCKNLEIERVHLFYSHIRIKWTCGVFYALRC